MYNYFPLSDGQQDDFASSYGTETKKAVENDVEESMSSYRRRHSRVKYFFSNFLPWLLVILLAIVIVVQQMTIWQFQHPEDHYIVSPYRTVLRQFGLETPYKSRNYTEAAEAWDRISSGHGDVSIDPTWAAARGLPPSMPHPYEPGKQVYQLEAYHAMHCLKSLRNHFMTLLLPDPESIHPSLGTIPENWDIEHDMHCFDELRQHIMCNADDGLMHSEGHRDIGFEQYRLCRDWDALERWATKNSACWKDHINPRPEGELWWHQCDDGDGLVRTGKVGL